MDLRYKAVYSIVSYNDFSLLTCNKNKTEVNNEVYINTSNYRCMYVHILKRGYE